MKTLQHASRWSVLRNSGRILKNPLPFHRLNFEKYGDTFAIPTLGAGKLVFSRDPVVVQQVLQKQHKSFSKSKLQTQELAKYIGEGILTAEGEHWRKHRRMIQPAFHMKSLRGLIQIMTKTIKGELEKLPTAHEIDMLPQMGDLAFQVVAKALFSSLEVSAPMARLKEITEINQEMLVREMRQPYLKWWFKGSGKLRKHLQYSAEARSILNELVDNRQSSDKETVDLLQMLLDATYEDGSKMSRAQLIDELMILFTAGHETTANALSFTLFHIAKDAELQNRLFKEVQSMECQEYSIENLSRLSLISSCIHEAMRIYPPAYVLDRVTTQEVEVNGFHFDKGTLVLLSLFELHRHKDFWQDPEVFIPQRFQTLSDKEFGDYYYPFGAGPRKCIGSAFATYEMIIAIAEIIKTFHLTTSVKSVTLNPLITLRPKEVLIQLKRREPQ